MQILAITGPAIECRVIVTGLISVRARPDESPAQTLYTCTLPIVMIRTCRGYGECSAVSCTMRNAEIDNEASGRKGCRSSMLEGGNFLAHCALGWGQETDVTVESN